MPECAIPNATRRNASNIISVRDFFHQNRPVITTFARLLDVVGIGASLWLITILLGAQWESAHTLAIACAISLFIFFAQPNDLYRSWRGASLHQEVLQVWLTWLAVILGLLLLNYVTKTSPEAPRSIFLTWFILAPSILTLWRAGIYTTIGVLRRHGINTRSVAIVGARDVSVQLANTLNNTPSMGLKLAGFYDDRAPTGARSLATSSHQVLGNLDSLIEQARDGKFDLIYITLPMRAEKRIQELIARLADTTVSVYFVPDLFTFSLMNTSWSHVGNLPTVSIHETPFYGANGWVKRVEDVVLSTAILALIAFPMLIIAAGIRLSSPGSIIFKQRRYGLQGQLIFVWKFRTMTVCEDGKSVHQATREDSRITPLGRFLRRTSLDELPQFFNVIQGHMSIVGPRPHAVAHNEEYRKLINGYMLRHKVKPGITGWAQVNGWRGETESLSKMRGRIEHDLAYIRNWSLWLDLKIIGLTIIKGFTGNNAY